MNSPQQGLKESRCGYERSAAVQRPSVSGVNNAAESNESFHVASGHHPVTANATLRSTGQSGRHPKGLNLFNGGQAHVGQLGVGDIDIADGCRAVRCGPIKQYHGAAFIPPPVRRFTTTNPNTLSPTYHLFYDLTKHIPRPSVPGGGGCNPNKPTAESAPGRTDQSHSVPNHRVSGDEFSDESNMTLGQLCTSTNHSIPTFTDIKLGEIHEKPPATSNFRSDILSHHQESMCCPNARQADAIERTQKFTEETPLHSRASDSKFADINANTSYSAAWVQNTKNIFNNSANHATRQEFSKAHNRPATNISAPVVRKQTGLPARQWKSREEKTQIQRDELDCRRDQSYPVVPSLDRVPCVHSNTETEHMKVSVTQALANERDTNVKVQKAVHFWKSNAAAQVNSSPGPPLKPDIYSSENFKTIPRSQFSGEGLDSRLRKRAVFKREGDSVRMFMVSDSVSGNTPCNHDSGVASDAEIVPAAQEKPAVPMSSIDYRKNSNSSLLSLPNFLLGSLKSKSKKTGTGAPKDNVKTVGGVVTINNDLLNGGGNSRVSKNQVNRWNNLHVRSAPSLSAGADEGKRIGATKEKLSAQSGLSTPALDIRKPALGRDPACHRSVGGEGGRAGRADNVGSNGPSTSAIKGILVNKDNVPTGNRSGHTHKANSVQFSEDSLNTEDNFDSSDTLKQRGEHVLFSNTSSATSRREVIDRNKYIIKRSVVTDGQHNLNLSRDTTRSASSDSLDNVYPGGDRITPQANSLETRDSSVKSDTSVDVRLESRVASENRHGQSIGVIIISHANPHSCKLSSVDNSGFRTGDTETYTPGLDKHHENSSTDGTRHEQQELSQLLESHSSRDGHSQLTALDNIRIAHSHICNFETVFPINVDRTTTKCVDIAESRLAGLASDITESRLAGLASDIAESRLADLASIKNKDKKDYSNERRDIGDLSPPSSHHPGEQKVPQKIRPRQKFEIRHNKISGKVGAQLRLNSQVNGDASETKYLDEDIGSGPANVTLSQHKESPRARFERDRAARSHAVTTGELTTDSLCERFKGDHKSDGDTLPGLIPPTSGNPVGVIASSSRCSGCVDDASPPPELPPPKLPPRVKLANKPLAASTVVSNRDRFTDHNSISLNGWLQSSPDIKADASETFVTCRQQHAEDTRAISGQRFLSSETKYISKDNYFITVDTQKQTFPHLDCCNSDQEIILNRNSLKNLCCDSKPELTDNLRSHVVHDSRQSEYEATTFNSVKNKLSPNNLLTRTEILSNQSTTASAHHFGDSGFKPRAPGGQRVSALKKVSPDSASSSGYDSEVNTSAIKTFFQGIDCVSNNEYIRQVLTRSSVQQLRLLFGHEDDHQESVKPQSPLDTGVLTSSPKSRWRSDGDFNDYDVSDIHNCSTDSNPKSRSPVGDPTRRIHQDGLHVSSSSSCQVKLNKEADSSSIASFHNGFPECCSHDSPRQYLGTESIEEYNRHAPWPLQCTPCEDWLENCDPSPGKALCPQTTEENFHSSVGNDVKGVNTGSGLSYIRALVVSEAEAEMLASKGIRIYESGEDYVAMVSPVKSPLHKSLSSPQFVWEGMTYLIIPTVLDSLGTSAVQNDSSAAQHGNNNNNNPDLFTHRSVSDSGATGHFLDNARSSMNDAPANNESDVYLTMMSSASGKLTEQNRAMSVEVLCTKEVKPNENWDHVTPSVGLVRRRKNKLTNDRGYVEWKTCSGWVGSTDMRTASDCRNSQGYVEWDTIWTTDAPWRSPTKGDEHVYDVIAEDQGPASQKTPSSPTNGSDIKDSTTDGVDTPPALPERTYIHRIKNINTNSASASHNENVCVRGASTQPSSRHNHSGHPAHKCVCIKHHHHHHHHSGKHHKSFTPRSTNPPPTPMPFSGQQPKHTGGVHSPKAAGSAQVWPSPGDPSQNYAEVNKLRGYTFSNLMLATDAPAPHHPDKTAVASENYWHLAPMTSPDSVTSWQTGDVLDYIDGLHDSMSPKRRENIYILLNNKKTRAKFSESLEIESRLLSRGLISNSCEGPSDKASDVLPTVKSGTVKPVVIRRKGAIAPVSSTYV